MSRFPKTSNNMGSNELEQRKATKARPVVIIALKPTVSSLFWVDNGESLLRRKPAGQSTQAAEWWKDGDGGKGRHQTVEHFGSGRQWPDDSPFADPARIPPSPIFSNSPPWVPPDPPEMSPYAFDFLAESNQSSLNEDASLTVVLGKFTRSPEPSKFSNDLHEDQMPLNAGYVPSLLQRRHDSNHLCEAHPGYQKRLKIAEPNRVSNGTILNLTWCDIRGSELHDFFRLRFVEVARRAQASAGLAKRRKNSNSATSSNTGDDLTVSFLDISGSIVRTSTPL
ncbi:hypothetical protein BDK51DRAFT_36823 [Blyttiomyces helicus]|uniref:Uncharacterized protein n=1 Tax=Blyttiomyces helicus TaxID=388810 RepID=A0A4P9WDK8_9FUNG|nr:hypothetical protein BDK51DRAFT_36823 [Blyttiomyces helicus]|eukprot:RKO90789.1 hypothetical protein BDK51DRAFT_36823 [Blyttiomyces helicus]